MNSQMSFEYLFLTFTITQIYQEFSILQGQKARYFEPFKLPGDWKAFVMNHHIFDLNITTVWILITVNYMYDGVVDWCIATTQLVL